MILQEENSIMACSVSFMKITMKSTNERGPASNGASDLALWEWWYLDQDGGTRGIEALQKEDWDDDFCKEAWAKYGHLAPQGYELCIWKHGEYMKTRWFSFF